MTFQTTEPVFRFRAGTAPLLISMPHVGTHLPPALAARLTEDARRVPDTDWHLEQLYDFAEAIGASVLVATHSRYVVDLNRPPDNANLYPGQDTTGLCPVDTFDKRPIYAAGDVPGEPEIMARVDAIWRPYHAQLQAELDRLKAVHGAAVLWDAHSIRSVLPRFFDGRLPDLNFGTAAGTSCSDRFKALLAAHASGPFAAAGYSSVIDGRFKGGYITRHYGQPGQGVDAMQLELAQCTYMREDPGFAYEPRAANRLKAPLRDLLAAFCS